MRVLSIQGSNESRNGPVVALGRRDAEDGRRNGVLSAVRDPEALGDVVWKENLVRIKSGPDKIKKNFCVKLR